jgi:acetaldehyde dehydrogenase/alcohol dehydrogenase
MAVILKLPSLFGVIAALTPVTNPTSTVIFKSIIAAKTRNVIIFSFHPASFNSSKEAAKIMLEAAVEAGAPSDCILWVENPSTEDTNYLMKHEGVNLILATGGAKMVAAAYASGKPALRSRATVMFLVILKKQQN